MSGQNVNSKSPSTGGPSPSPEHRGGSANQKHRRSMSKSGEHSSRSSSLKSGGAPKPNGSGHNRLSPQLQSVASKHMDDRTLYLLANAIGSKCIVTVTSGTRYTGLLYTTSSFLEGGLSCVLKFPELYSLDSDDELDPNYELPETLVIESKDLADLEIVDLDLSADAAPALAEPQKTSFKTDVDISAGKIQSQERELEKWVPEEISSGIGGGLEDESVGGSGQWDQFAVNEKKFGIQSTFDENLYTTKISKDDPKYQQRLLYAEKVAREIESSGHNGNVHLAEERGLVVDDSGYDEEDKYSGVDRRGEELMAAIKGGAFGNGSTGNVQREFKSDKYVPPRHRAALYHDDPAILSSTDMKANETKPVSVNSLPEKPKELIKLKENRPEIDALKEFSANFKIPTKFPSKDKSPVEPVSTKTEEIKKEEPSKPESVVAEKLPAATPLKKKMDPKTAITFKMNPNAASFQPMNFQPPQGPRGSFSSRSPNASHASPRVLHSSPSKKYMTPVNFFGTRVPNGQHKTIFSKSFNFFKHVGSLEKLEKPFVAAPTWAEEIDQSYMNEYELYPEKISMPLPPNSAMRYYGSAQSPMAPPQFFPPGAPISPQHPQLSPIPVNGPIIVPSPVQAQFPNPEDGGGRTLSPSHQQLVPLYYPPFIPAGGAVPNLQARGPPQQQDLSTSPRMHRQKFNNSNNMQRQQPQQMFQLQPYPMFVPMPPGAPGAPALGSPGGPRGSSNGVYPLMGYYVVGPPNGGRQF